MAAKWFNSLDTLRYWFLVTFCNNVTEIQKYYVIFVYILQGKMGKTENTENEIMQLKWLRYQKPKDENIGWTKQRMPCVLLPKKKILLKESLFIFEQLKIQDSWIQNWGFDLISMLKNTQYIHPEMFQIWRW